MSSGYVCGLTRMSMKSTQQECSAGGGMGQGGNNEIGRKRPYEKSPDQAGLLVLAFENFYYLVGNVLAADIISPF